MLVDAPSHLECDVDIRSTVAHCALDEQLASSRTPKMLYSLTQLTYSCPRSILFRDDYLIHIL